MFVLHGQNGNAKIVAFLVLCSLLLPVSLVGASDGSPTVPEDGIAAETGAILIDGENQLVAQVATYGWNGSGTAADPYVIENMTINGSGSTYCLAINNLHTSHVVIRNNTLHTTIRGSASTWKQAGIGIKSCKDVTVVNNTIQDAVYYGILAESTGFYIANNTIRNSMYGVRGKTETANTVIEHNTITAINLGIHTIGPVHANHNTITGYGPNSGIGMYVTTQGSSKNNSISNFSEGLRLFRGVSKYNTIRDCGDYGIMVFNYGTTIENSTIINCTTGIGLGGARNVLHDNELVSSPIMISASSEGEARSHIISTTNTLNGKPIQYLKATNDVDIQPGTYGQSIMADCSNVDFRNRTIAGEFWFDAFYCDNMTLEGNDVDLSIPAQWRISDCTDVVVTDNELTNASLYLSGAKHTVSGNTFEDAGIYTSSAIGTRIHNNTFSSTGPTPISIMDTTNMELMDNNITIMTPAIDLYGIELSGNFYDLAMRNNTLVGAGMSDPWPDDNHYTFEFPDIDRSNTVNGRPILCLDRVADRRISGEYGQVIINNSAGVLIEKVDMGEDDGGIWIHGTEDIVVDDCVFTGLMNGAVNIKYSKNVSVTRCLFQEGSSRLTLIDCNRGYSPWGKIYQNYFMNLTTKDGTGAAVTLRTTILNWVTQNLIAGIEGYGLITEGSGSQTHIKIMANEISNCTRQAFLMDNLKADIYLNSFLDNGVDISGAQCTSDDSATYWDRSGEGNYWSDYETRYPDASNDGTEWDDPYLIGESGDTSDRYPLVAYTDRIPPWMRMFCNDTAYPGVPGAFTSHAVDNQGIVDYNWSISIKGDVTDLQGPDVTHTFNRSGVHTVTLRVTDAAGLWTEVTKKVRVIDTLAPVAFAGEDMEVIPGTNVTLDGSASWDDAAIVSHVWTFEYDGSPVELEGMQPRFTFDIEGSYDITLTVTDRVGNWHSDTVTITVGDTQPPIAVIGEDLETPQGITLWLSGLGSSDNWRIETYEWMIRSPTDVITHYDEPLIAHNFSEAGVHTVTLLVTDPKGLTDETTINVTARDITPPVAVAGEGVVIGQNTPVYLDGSGSTDNEVIVEWTWTISGPDQDLVLDGPTVYHTFPDVGEYIVILTVVDAWGNNGSAPIIVVVVDTEPPVAVVGNDLVIEPGEKVDLDGSPSTDNVGIYSYTWTFVYDRGDMTKIGQFMSFIFDLPGTYPITLTVVDMMRNEGSATVTVEVRDLTPPVADAGEDILVDQHQSLPFNGGGSSDNVEVVEYRWTFLYDGEEKELEGVDPTFTFDLPGHYEITLKVTDGGGNLASDTMTVTVVDIEPPTADWPGALTFMLDEEAVLDGSGSSDNVGITSWTWSFEYGGTMRTLEGETVTFDFEEVGNYRVTLTVTDAMGLEGKETNSVLIQGREPEPSPPPVDENEFSWALLGGIVVALAVVILVTWMLVRRRMGTE